MTNMTDKIQTYREEIVEINNEILKLLTKRGEVAQKIGEEKRKQGTVIYDPQREKEMINELVEKNEGPFNDNVIKQLFKEIFKASTDLQKSENEKHLYVSRKLQPEDTIVQFDNGAKIGDGQKIICIWTLFSRISRTSG
ncbi:bifunctional 3-deoxy-7-phosphoheptulonate synthase/chorismate mutase [Staphylococcus auricularis]|nr:bifunctional 3-deoxy-7-phosphoheptulonate synthase/chorismate mutase [Staphylococcus auricularis]